MAVKHVDLDDCYIPETQDQDIIVSVEIGDGQSGAYTIFLGRKLVSANMPANLGNKSHIGKKNTIITVTVVDTLKETNWTSMTVFVKEGTGDPTQFGPYKVQAENHLDIIIYSLKLSHQ